MNTKDWYRSKGVWGAVTTIIVAVMALIGFAVDAQSQAQMTDLLLAVGGGIGGLIALWGRIAARERIGKGGGELGFARLSMLALLAAFSLGLYGCAGTGFEVRQADIPVSQELSEEAQAAQRAINEANIALAAAKSVIGDKVVSGAITPDEAQAYLDETRKMDTVVDTAQAALDAGDPRSAQGQAALLNMAITTLARELAKRTIE